MYESRQDEEWRRAADECEDAWSRHALTNCGCVIRTTCPALSAADTGSKSSMLYCYRELDRFSAIVLSHPVRNHVSSQQPRPLASTASSFTLVAVSLSLSLHMSPALARASVLLPSHHASLHTDRCDRASDRDRRPGGGCAAATSSAEPHSRGGDEVMAVSADPHTVGSRACCLPRPSAARWSSSLCTLTSTTTAGSRSESERSLPRRKRHIHHSHLHSLHRPASFTPSASPSL